MWLGILSIHQFYHSIFTSNQQINTCSNCIRSVIFLFSVVLFYCGQSTIYVKSLIRITWIRITSNKFEINWNSHSPHLFTWSCVTHSTGKCKQNTFYTTCLTKRWVMCQSANYYVSLRLEEYLHKMCYHFRFVETIFPFENHIRIGLYDFVGVLKSITNSLK